MVLCNIQWSDVKGCSYGDCKNYAVDLGKMGEEGSRFVYGSRK